MTGINTNIAANNAQRHLTQHSRKLAAQFKAAAQGGDIAEISTGLAKYRLLTTASSLVLRKANDLQAHSIDLIV
jgi:flagellin-like hook-associated protein FlgL